MRTRVWFIVAGLFLFQHSCLPTTPDLNCSRCPCPEEGYICIDALCIKKDSLSLYASICADVLAAREKTDERGGPDRLPDASGLPETKAEPSPQDATENPNTERLACQFGLVSNQCLTDESCCVARNHSCVSGETAQGTKKHCSCDADDDCPSDFSCCVLDGFKSKVCLFTQGGACFAYEPIPERPDAQTPDSQTPDAGRPDTGTREQKPGIDAAIGPMKKFISFGDTWKYHDKGVPLGTAWRGVSFDDTTWSSGPGQLGYGDGDEATKLRKASPPQPSVYFRKKIRIPARAVFAYLQVIHDDGVAVWINGTLVFSKYVANGMSYKEWASDLSYDNEKSQKLLDLFTSNPFVVGENVIAVMIKQESASSSDISFDLELSLSLASSSEFPSTEKPSLPDGGTSEQPPDAPGAKKLHEACREGPLIDASEGCGPGLKCVRLDGFRSHCLQDCSADATVCTKNNNRTQCRLVQWRSETESVSVCVQPLGKDQSCDLAKSKVCYRNGPLPLACLNQKCVVVKYGTSAGTKCDKSLSTPELCDVAKRLVCDKGTCTKGRTVFEGEDCSARDTLCEEKTTCRDFASYNLKICTRDCSADTDCKSSFVCYTQLPGVRYCAQQNCTHHTDCILQRVPFNCRTISTGKAQCLPFPKGGKADIHDKCSNPGQVFCKAPFDCYRLSSTFSQGQCVAQCKTNADCAAFGQFTACIGSSPPRVCINLCSKTADCPKSGMYCIPAPTTGYCVYQ